MKKSLFLSSPWVIGMAAIWSVAHFAKAGNGNADCPACETLARSSSVTAGTGPNGMTPPTNVMSDSGLGFNVAKIVANFGYRPQYTLPSNLPGQTQGGATALKANWDGSGPLPGSLTLPWRLPQTNFDPTFDMSGCAVSGGFPGFFFCAPATPLALDWSPGLAMGQSGPKSTSLAQLVAAAGPGEDAQERVFQIKRKFDDRCAGYRKANDLQKSAGGHSLPSAGDSSSDSSDSGDDSSYVPLPGYCL